MQVAPTRDGTSIHWTDVAIDHFVEPVVIGRTTDQTGETVAEDRFPESERASLVQRSLSRSKSHPSSLAASPSSVPRKPRLFRFVSSPAAVNRSEVNRSEVNRSEVPHSQPRNANSEHPA